MSSQLTIPFDESIPSAGRVGRIFGVTGKELNERMGQLATASLAEYEQAFSGERFPSTIRELRELRLCLLYEHLPDGLPTDEQIAELFQMTRTQVATLIAGTRARFGPEVEGRMTKAAIVALKGATKVNDDMVRIVVPDSLGRYMNDLVAQTQAPPIEKRRDASQTYDVGRDTIVALCARLALDPKAVKAIDWP